MTAGSEDLGMFEFLLGTICLIVGMVAIGTAGAMRKQHARGGWRFGIAGVGMFSAIAAVVLIARSGGIAGIILVSSALTVLIGVGVLIWYLVLMVSSLDEALTPRQPPATPDFQFLQEEGPPVQATSGKRSSRIKQGFKRAQERIAKMEFLNGWSFMRRPPQ